MTATKTPTRPAKGHSRPAPATAAKPTLTEQELAEARAKAMGERVKACDAEVRAVLEKHRCRLDIVPDPTGKPVEVAPGVWVNRPVPLLVAQELAAPGSQSPA